MKSFFLILTALVCFVTLSFAESGEETVGQPVTEQILEEARNLSEEPLNMPDSELEEEPQEEQDNTPGEESTSEPTDTPEETPMSEPTDTPTETPTGEPTDTPEETPTGEPTDTPEETPMSEPTDTPEETPTGEPTDTPTEMPTSEPTPTPPVTCFVLEPADGQLTELLNGVWHFKTENDYDAMIFQWTSDYIPSGVVYSICVDDSFLTEPVLEEPITLVTSESSCALQVRECTRGRITVTMMVEGEILASASLDFVSDRVIPPTEPPATSPPPATEEPAVTETPSPEPSPVPSTEPKNNHSGMPKWRGMTRKGNSGGKTENESGITPGKALTSGHAKGNGDMTIYGAAESDLSAESCTAFITGEDIPPIVLEKTGGSFACREEAAALYLIPLDEGSGWTVPVRALYALNLAGYQELKLYLGETETSLSTSFEPVGRTWARLRTRGIVVENCVLTVTEDKLFLHANDVDYRVNEDGTLSETEAGIL